jgi:6-phosphogluconolactonase
VAGTVGSTDIHVLDDPAAVVAELMAEAARAGSTIVLTGGSTPRAAYEKAAELGGDWSGADLWFTDERCVPPDDEHSNYGMAARALLDRVSARGVHRMQGELGPHEGAAAYEEEIAAAFGAEPRFDLMLLGLGPDGHVASLFPGDAALGERERSVVGVDAPGMAPLVPRITLTLPAINRARDIVVLVTGEGKAEAVARAFGSPRPTPDVPASLVTPEDGTMTVLLDPGAASRLLRRT